MSKPTNSNLFLVLAGPQIKIARLAVSFLPPQHLPSQKFLFKQWQLTQPSHRAGANVYPWPPFKCSILLCLTKTCKTPSKSVSITLSHENLNPVHMHWPPASEFPHFTALLRWRQAARNDELTDNLVRSEKTETTWVRLKKPRKHWKWLKDESFCGSSATQCDCVWGKNRRRLVLGSSAVTSGWQTLAKGTFLARMILHHGL